MLASLLIAALLAADPAAEQPALLKTFRAEFVQLTPGTGDFPVSFLLGDASRGDSTTAAKRMVRVEPFAIAKYEMPQNLYESVMGNNPSRWKGPRNSVEEVTFANAQDFCRQATLLLRGAGLIEAHQLVRLPTELEWEYACKAGSDTPYSFGDNAAQLDDYAWHTGNAAGNDPPVGAKKPNAWGLYDMHGYLWEWTTTPFQADAQRIVKSGSWRDEPARLVSHSRLALLETDRNDALGFRCVLANDQPAATGFQATAQEKFFAPEAQLKLLWNEGEFTEGPAWSPAGFLLFSDIGTKIYRYDPAGGKVTVFREESGRSNGLVFNTQGELIACEGANNGNRRISVTSVAGEIRTLADSYQGKRFNSPNDLALDPQGNVYFSDPRYVGDEPRELDFEAVFRVNQAGEVQIATRDVSKPNGIVITADGRHAFVADHNSQPDGKKQLLRFDLAEDGTLKSKVPLYNFGTGRGIDGMTLDAQGNVYATAGSGELAGIYVFGPAGEQLAFLPLPGDPTNCTFGGGELANCLFITAEGPIPTQAGVARKYALYCIELGKPE